ncbi:MAG: peptidase M3, partial [Prevotellaceae bacterium]|nr:peptidase M3 [Prevotellaceae bacterium]
MKKYLFILGLILMSYSACKQNVKSSSLDNSNPFASEYNTPRNLPPFDRIKTEHYKPAFLAGIEDYSAEIEVIANNSKAPSFENTVVALDGSGSLLNRVHAVFFAIASANTDSILQAL